MPRITVITRDNVEHVIDAQAGVSLMETLRDHNLDVEGVCGGSLSCATCHIYVDEAWRDKVGPPDDSESALLEDLVHEAPNSRLCCQVTMLEEWRGLVVTVAPPEA